MDDFQPGSKWPYLLNSNKKSKSVEGNKPNSFWNDEKTLILRWKISIWTSQNWCKANIGVNRFAKIICLIFVTVASSTQRSSKRNAGNGNAVSPCISSVNFEFICNDCLELRMGYFFYLVVSNNYVTSADFVNALSLICEIGGLLGKNL